MRRPITAEERERFQNIIILLEESALRLNRQQDPFLFCLDTVVVAELRRIVHTGLIHIDPGVSPQILDISATAAIVAFARVLAPFVGAIIPPHVFDEASAAITSAIYEALRPFTGEVFDPTTTATVSPSPRRNNGDVDEDDVDNDNAPHQ